MRQDLNLYRLYPKQVRYQVTPRTEENNKQLQREQDLNLYYRLWRTAFYRLNYPQPTFILMEVGFEPTKRNAKGLQPFPFGLLGTPYHKKHENLISVFFSFFIEKHGYH